jgi:hypothetical protein
VSRYDEFEKVKVDKMVGNAVSGKILARTVVCLNAMRESKWLPAATNQTVAYTTNFVVTSVTNQTVTTSANEQIASTTNAMAAPSPSAPTPATQEGETNQPVVVTSIPGDSTAYGLTISTSRNESVATAPNQVVVSSTVQTVTTVSGQATVNTNSQSITGGTNQLITVETNLVITTYTNTVVTPVTNIAVISPELPAFDYYLYTEIAPADFSLQPGESLVVLADGARFAFTPSNPQSGWNSRRGFLTTFYKAPPEAIEAIANAEEVRLRIKGTNGMLERRLNRSSRRHFHDFLLKHFGPQPEVTQDQKNKDANS